MSEIPKPVAATPDAAVREPAPAAPPPPPQAPPSAPRRRGPWDAWRPLVMRLHFYAGLLIAPFLVVAALTGLIYTAMPQVERIVHDKELTVASVGERRVPLSEQVRAARRAHPEGTISAVRPPRESDGTTRVVLAVDGLEEGYSRTVFVDPYSGRVRGTLTTFGEWLPVRAWFDELHRTLHFGDTGRLYSELAASWLWLIVLAGLTLWIQRRRRARRHRTKAGAPRGRRRLVGVHGAIGATIAIALLGLSATGLTWSKHAGANVTDLREELSWSTPALASAPTGGHSGHGGHGSHAGHAPEVESAIDGVVGTARRAGLDGPIEATPPGEPGATWVVTQVKRSWPEKQDSVTIDPASGRVVDQLRFADWPLAAKLARWGIDAHMALLFGIANQILLALVALGLIAMVALGYRMWWLRRPKRGAGRALPQGAWRSLPRWSLPPLVLAAAAVGWFLPVFGVSLVALLVLDAALGAINRRRAGAPA